MSKIKDLLEKTNIRERADDIWAFQKEGNLSYDQREAIKKYSCLLRDAAKIIDQVLELLKQQPPAGDFTKKMDIWFGWCLTNLDTIRASVNPLCFKLYDEVITSIKDVRRECFARLDTSEASKADLERRLKAHSAGEAVRHFCRDCLKPFWNVDDEPMICPHCGSKEMPIIDPDAKRIA